MAAEVIRLDDHDYVPRSTTRMTIPLQSTVAAFMHEKMGWSREFCNHYADRFWNHYQAQGWKLSNGNAMKDWRAAFNSQWKTPKNEEDRKLLAESIAKQKEAERNESPADYLNRCLDLHRRGQYKPKAEEVLGIYQWLKERKMLRLTHDEVEYILRETGNNRNRSRMLAVRVLFDRMNLSNERFAQASAATEGGH